MAAPRLTIVGGGTAALEALLAARRSLAQDADLCLLAPEREFRYRPIDPDAVLRPVAERGLRIAELVAKTGARWVVDRAAVVDDAQRNLLTRDGDTLDFDYALIAAGGRARRALHCGEVWMRGGDPGCLDDTIDRVRRHRSPSVAVVVPRGARWSVPAYELALVIAWSTAEATGRTVTLVSAEAAPLAALGEAVSAAVAQELAAAGIELITGVEAFEDPDAAERRLTGAAHVVLVPEDPAAATDALTGRPSDPEQMRLSQGTHAAYDRLISLPTVSGPGIEGLATDACGFLDVDETLRVRGATRTWAAGACVAATLEHSALAARQADAAIDAIARTITGGGGSTERGATELTGMLLTGQRDAWLAANPPGTLQPSTRCLWWPPGRAVGALLAEQIAAWDPTIESALPGFPNGLLIEAPVHFDHSSQAPHPIAWGSEEERRRDIEARQRRALGRRSRDADAELHELETRLDSFAAREARAIAELRAHGYLRGH